MKSLVTIPHISLNIPVSKKASIEFPPKQYPLCLSVMFSKRADDFYGDLKDLLETIPKSQVKYKASKNVITTFNCYCHSLESMLPIFNEALGKTKMYVRYGMIQDKRIYPEDLWKEGKLLLEIL